MDRAGLGKGPGDLLSGRWQIGVGRKVPLCHGPLRGMRVRAVLDPEGEPDPHLDKSGPQDIPGR